MAGKSVFSDPPVQALEGDDQIRTGVVGLSTDPAYERFSGSGLAPVYGAAITLIIAADLPYGLLVWAAVWSGLVFRATSKGSRLRGDAQSPQQTGGVS